MRKKTAAIMIVLCICLSLLVFIPQAKANPKFIIADWDYPDEYGQGIEGFQVYENSTGSWVAVGGEYYYYNSQVFDWNASIGIKLRCYSWLNSSLLLLDFPDEGYNYQRHNVTVTQSNGTIVFNQENFTCTGGETWALNPMWKYYYDVVLDFLPAYGEIYTVTVTYEVWW
jgi:hypothetical protein